MRALSDWTVSRPGRQPDRAEVDAEQPPRHGDPDCRHRDAGADEGAVDPEQLVRGLRVVQELDGLVEGRARASGG